MTGSTRSFAILFSLVTLAVNTAVLSAPLPVQRRPFTAQKLTTVEHSSEAEGVTPTVTAFSIVPRLPPAYVEETRSSLMRGSSMASKAAAEVKKRQKSRSTVIPFNTDMYYQYHVDLEAASSVLALSATDVPTPTWLINKAQEATATQSKSAVDSKPPTHTGTSSEDYYGIQYDALPSVEAMTVLSLAPAATHSATNGTTSASSSAVPSITPCAGMMKVSTTQWTLGHNDDEDERQNLDSLYGDEEGMDSSIPQEDLLYSANNSDPMLSENFRANVYERSIKYAKHRVDESRDKSSYRAKGGQSGAPVKTLRLQDTTQADPESDSRGDRRSLLISGNGVDIRLEGGDTRYIESATLDHNRSFINLSLRRKSNESFTGQKEPKHADHQPARVMTIQPLLRRLAVGLPTSPVALVGQLGILQPLVGSLGAAGVSQLVANLVLAPLSNGASAGSYISTLNTIESASQSNASTLADATNKGDKSAYLLAPSTSSGGIKLQMVEMPWMQSPDSQHKVVEFQATLTNAQNEPHLYCAVVRPTSTLRMELCSQDNSSVATDAGDLRVFQYDPSTGEVVPFKPDMTMPAAKDGSSPSSVNPAVTSSSQTTWRRNMMGVANLSPDGSIPKAIKLVFFPDQLDSSSNGGDSSVSGPSSSPDMGDPPLLDAEQLARRR